MQRVSLALGHIHRAGVIHCDIKPSNIMLDDSDEPVVIDFGMSIRPSAVDASRIKTASHGYIVGTPEYMAPEQITGESKNYTPAIDIYAVGATLFELLAGRPPFEPTIGGNAMAVVQAVLSQPAPSVKSLNAGVPDDVDALIRRCLDKSPTKRIQTADELAVKLNDCRRGRALDALPKKTIARRLSGFFFKEIFLPKKPKDK
jgi:serine/threonine protein kinase